MAGETQQKRPPLVDQASLFGALLLGLVEGLTEFVPVSSTGHLILLVELIGFQGPPGAVFEVVIQLGAIFAVCFVYRQKLTRVALHLFDDPASFAFARNVLLAFLPAMVLGFLLHGFIKSVLFSPWVVSVALILGGIAILVIERNLRTPRVHEIEAIGPLLAIKIGLCQTLAMIPGVSRSGATIMGGLLLGLSRKAAAEFSFFLAIPTMLAATAYDVYRNRALLSLDDVAVFGVGFVCSFLAAMVAVKAFVRYVSHNSFAPFAWYRIAFGLFVLGSWQLGWVDWSTS